MMPQRIIGVQPGVRSGVQRGVNRRVSGSGFTLDTAVEAYQIAEGITDSAARQIDSVLSQIRGAGAAIDFLAVFGSDYNPSNTAAVIGAAGEDMNAGANLAQGSNYVRRTGGGDYLRFPIPAALKGAALSEIGLAVWYVAAASDQFLVSTEVPAVSRGLKMRSLSSLQPQGVVGTGAASSFNINPLGDSQLKFPGWHADVVSAIGVNVAGLFDSDYENRSGVIPSVHQTGDYIYIGIPNSASTDGQTVDVGAVAMFSDTPSTHDSMCRIADSGYHLNQSVALPVVHTEGDSTLSAFGPQEWIFAGGVGGPWQGTPTANDATGGEDIRGFLTSLSRNVGVLSSLRKFDQVFFLHAIEQFQAGQGTANGHETLEAYHDAYFADFLEPIAATGCTMLIFEYTNPGFPEAQITASNARCASRGWQVIPAWQNPHARVTFGDGWHYYREAQSPPDPSHETEGGQRIRAQLFAAHVTHPSITGYPRFDPEDAPAITGTLETGSELSVALGTPLVAGTTTTYQWIEHLEYSDVGAVFHDGIISGETSATYTPTTAGRVACRVTMTNATGYAEWTTDPVVVAVETDSDVAAYGATHSAGDLDGLSAFANYLKAESLWSRTGIYALKEDQNADAGLTAFDLGGLGWGDLTLVNGPTRGTHGIALNPGTLQHLSLQLTGSTALRVSDGLTGFYRIRKTTALTNDIHQYLSYLDGEGANAGDFAKAAWHHRILGGRPEISYRNDSNTAYIGTRADDHVVGTADQTIVCATNSSGQSSLYQDDTALTATGAIPSPGRMVTDGKLYIGALNSGMIERTFDGTISAVVFVTGDVTATQREAIRGLIAAL